MVNCFEDDGQWFVTTQPHVKQIDSASCGVFCLKVIRILLLLFFALLVRSKKHNALTISSGKRQRK